MTEFDLKLAVLSGSLLFRLAYGSTGEWEEGEEQGEGEY
jgi:hypothetical protein